MSVKRSGLFCFVFAAPLLVFCLAVGKAAAQTCPVEVGRLASLQGVVEVQRTGASSWQKPTLNAPMCQGDTVRVGLRSRAAIGLINDAVLRIDQNTTMRLTNVVREPEKKSVLSLLSGIFQSFSRSPRKLEVNTAYLNGSIEGTEFVIELRGNKAVLTVLEGTVVASNPRGRETLTSGQLAQGTATTGPQKRIVARPRDAVQWGLYYPPVLAGGEGADRPIVRAAELLNVGRVDEARLEIDRAISAGGNAALGYALRAVINVVQNRVAEALVDGSRAVEQSPNAAAARIALSYAQQAAYQLPAARDTLVRAVSDEPANAMAWARLSELRLMLGERSEAREAAEKAVSIAPRLARTQSVLGFAALVAIRTGAAIEAFRKAISLDSAFPLPRLGLGLALIREGNLAEGRKEIEVAVGLDSQNALVRAYLGKAYYEERRGPLAGEQLAIAKQLDPNDPTAYLYEAIRLQTENRPVEALNELQGSIERNDNRAVFRSRLALDQDRAARGVSLATVYNDLGFNRAGMNEAVKSLTINPGNASAHRFLSDMYGSVRRHEIARVSELLQAQLLQDININPVQPSLSETNLNIVAGGGPAGFNEFTPLFERNRVQFNLSGVGGNDDTWGGEAVASAIYDRFSFSAGAFRFGSDGFRPNHDLDHEIYNVFAQAALTPDFNVQGEFRYRKTNAGDLTFNVDQDIFDPSLDRELEQKIMRFGARYTFGPRSKLLLSYIRSNRKETTKRVDPLSPILGASLDRLDPIDDVGNQYEGQYQFNTETFNVVAGGGYSNIDRDRTQQQILNADFAGFPPPFDFIIPAGSAGDVFATAPLDETIGHRRAYVYVNYSYPTSLTWTVGGSFDDLDRTGAGRSQLNPKVGVQWNATDTLRFRAAAFQVVKPVIVANRSIEPTQLAGFNQMHDDINGTQSVTYGFGVDWQATPTLLMGAQATTRKYEERLSSIRFGAGAGQTFSDPFGRDEDILRGYVNWSPLPRWSTNLDVVVDRFNADSGNNLNQQFFPEKVKTISVPAGVRYFDPTGWFAGVNGTYVKQDVDRFAASSLPDSSESFFVLDATLGYRLPHRRGVISFHVANLLDSKFKYQDDNFREFRDDPTSGPYIPEITFVARGSLQF